MSKNVQAMFRCNSVTTLEGGIQSVDLAAATLEGNEGWATTIPSAALRLTITNPKASGAFEPGKMYYLTISADPPAKVEEPKLEPPTLPRANRGI